MISEDNGHLMVISMGKPPKILENSLKILKKPQIFLEKSLKTSKIWKILDNFLKFLINPSKNHNNFTEIIEKSLNILKKSLKTSNIS